jgi:hypothetical protein
MLPNLQGRWRKHRPLKRRYPTTPLHGVTTQNSNIHRRENLKPRKKTGRFTLQDSKTMTPTAIFLNKII